MPCRAGVCTQHSTAQEVCALQCRILLTAQRSRTQHGCPLVVVLPDKGKGLLTGGHGGPLGLRDFWKFIAAMLSWQQRWAVGHGVFTSARLWAVGSSVLSQQAACFVPGWQGEVGLMRRCRLWQSSKQAMSFLSFRLSCSSQPVGCLCTSSALSAFCQTHEWAAAWTCEASPSLQMSAVLAGCGCFHKAPKTGVAELVSLNSNRQGGVPRSPLFFATGPGVCLTLAVLSAVLEFTCAARRLAYRDLLYYCRLSIESRQCFAAACGMCL